MFKAHSFVDELRCKYHPPSNHMVHFDVSDIHSFENALGVEFPSDFCGFLEKGLSSTGIECIPLAGKLVGDGYFIVYSWEDTDSIIADLDIRGH